MHKASLGGVKGYAIILFLLFPHSSRFWALTGVTGWAITFSQYGDSSWSQRSTWTEHSTCADSQCMGMALTAWPVLHLMPPPWFYSILLKALNSVSWKIECYFSPLFFACLFSAACPGLKGGHKMSFVRVCVIKFLKPFFPLVGGR